MSFYIDRGGGGFRKAFNFRYFICLVACLLMPGMWHASKGQTVSGVTAMQEGKNIVVEYYISAPAASVSLIVSTDGGKTFSRPLKEVSGDISDVAAGSHRIVWDVVSEWGGISGENVVFEVSCISSSAGGPPAKVPDRTRASSVPSDLKGRKYADLGLSVKWAVCNIGALGPEDRGGYYAWGGVRNDVAQSYWGGTWRVPSAEEWEELRTRCKWVWTTCKGHRGYKIISKVRGYEKNWIFLRADGCREGRSVSRSGTNGYYWTSSISLSTGKPLSIRFNDGTIRQAEERTDAIEFSIRPVSP